jgi:hypothetical protein
MSKPKRKPQTVSEIFMRERARRPGISYADIAVAVSQNLGQTVNVEMIRQYHLGLIKQRPNLAVIAAIAEFYGLKAGDLPPDVMEVCARWRTVFDGIGVPSTPPGIRTPNLQISAAA